MQLIASFYASSDIKESMPKRLIPNLGNWW